MKKKLILSTAVVGVVLPFAINEYYNSRCPELPKGLVISETAKAVPSFARQTGFSCNTCHTIPPRLNSYGRIFKMRGYTDGKAISSITTGTSVLTGKKESILKFNPVSIRVLSFPYSKKKGEDREFIFPDEFAVTFAGKVAENIGAFVEFASDEGEAFEPEMIKVAATKSFGNSIVGIVGGQTAPTRTDPFESLNLDSTVTRAKTPVWESIQGNSTADLWESKNYGASAYAYINNLVYVNLGAYTGLVQNGDDEVINKGKSDPFDIYGRIAITPHLPADVNIGAFFYNGRDKDPTTDNTLIKPRRYGFDAGVIYNIGDIGLEFNGIYVNGKDKFSSNPDFKHSGYNLAAILYWKYRVDFSLKYGEYKFKSDNPLTSENEDGVKRKDTTVHLSYLLRPNVKIGAEYTKYNYSEGQDSSLTSLLFDFAF